MTNEVVREERAERKDLVARSHVPTVAELIETGRVRQQVADADRLVERRIDLERRQVTIHVGVQIEQSTVDQLHHGRAGHHLADRTDPQNRSIHDHRLIIEYFGAPERVRVDQIATMNDRNRCAGDVEFLLACSRTAGSAPRQAPRSRCGFLSTHRRALPHTKRFPGRAAPGRSSPVGPRWQGPPAGSLSGRGRSSRAVAAAVRRATSVRESRARRRGPDRAGAVSAALQQSDAP